MIKYALACAHGHAFEGWFASSDAFDEQAERGLVECPICGSTEVRKQIMAPAVATRETRAPEAAGKPVAGNEEASTPANWPSPKDMAKLAEAAAKVRAHISKTYSYVGDKFADEARAMNDGEKDQAPIYGEATPAEAKALIEEGASPLCPPPSRRPRPKR